MFLVAKDCIRFQKDPKIWGATGCYGYPAAVLLFSIANSIGSYVVGGNTRKHFDILIHVDYYSLGLKSNEVNIIYKSYRSLLTHNGVMAPNTLLDIGKNEDAVFEIRRGIPKLNLAPFLKLTDASLSKFLGNAEAIVTASQQFENILRKSPI